MPKKFIIVLGVLLIVVVGCIFYFSRISSKTVSPLVNNKTTGKVIDLGKLKKYYDPSGFEFSYPERLKLIPKKTADQTNYADLALSADNITGALSIKANDTNYSDIDEYLLEKNASQSASSKKIKLADIDAREISTEEGTVIFGLDEGVLFKINIDYGQDKDYWQKIKETLVKSFSFIIPTQAPSSGKNSPDAGGDIVDEGEEIVE